MAIKIERAFIDCQRCVKEGRIFYVCYTRLNCFDIQLDAKFNMITNHWWGLFGILVEWGTASAHQSVSRWANWRIDASVGGVA